MDIFSQSEQLRQALTPFIQKIVNEQTRECLRTYKAKVVLPPNSEGVPVNKCVVQLMGQSGAENPTTLTLPYSSSCSDIEADEMVWIATTYGSWRNAIVWQKMDFESDGGKSAYEIWLD